MIVDGSNALHCQVVHMTRRTWRETEMTVVHESCFPWLMPYVEYQLTRKWREWEMKNLMHLSQDLTRVTTYLTLDTAVTIFLNHDVNETWYTGHMTYLRCIKHSWDTTYMTHKVWNIADLSYETSDLYPSLSTPGAYNYTCETRNLKYITPGTWQTCDMKTRNKVHVKPDPIKTYLRHNILDPWYTSDITHTWHKTPDTWQNWFGNGFNDIDLWNEVWNHS